MEGSIWAAGPWATFTILSTIAAVWVLFWRPRESLGMRICGAVALAAVFGLSGMHALPAIVFPAGLAVLARQLGVEWIRHGRSP